MCFGGGLNNLGGTIIIGQPQKSNLIVLKGDIPTSANLFCLFIPLVVFWATGRSVGLLVHFQSVSLDYREVWPGNQNHSSSRMQIGLKSVPVHILFAVSCCVLSASLDALSSWTLSICCFHNFIFELIVFVVPDRNHISLFGDRPTASIDILGKGKQKFL